MRIFNTASRKPHNYFIINFAKIVSLQLLNKKLFKNLKETLKKIIQVKKYKSHEILKLFQYICCKTSAHFFNMKNSFLHTMLPILALCLIISNANKGFAKSYNNNNMHPATSFTGKKNMSLRKENKTWLKLTITTYNIRHASLSDKKSGNDWNIRKKPLANLIKSHNPDIIGTQEGNNKQLNDLKNLLPDYDYIGHSYGGKDGKLHNCATFYKTDKFEILDKGVFWYSETPDTPSIGWDATDQRICHWTKFKEKKSGKTFFVFNSHFYWQFITARKNSGNVLIDKIQQITEGLPVICTGDYNSTESTPQIQKITSVLNDAYKVTETHPVGPVGTGFPGGIFQGIPKNRIDYIFVSPFIRVLSYKVLTNSYNNGHYPSDHLPITCNIAIPFL